MEGMEQAAGIGLVQVAEVAGVSALYLIALVVLFIGACISDRHRGTSEALGVSVLGVLCIGVSVLMSVALH